MAVTKAITMTRVGTCGVSVMRGSVLRRPDPGITRPTFALTGVQGRQHQAVTPPGTRKRARPRTRPFEEIGRNRRKRSALRELERAAGLGTAVLLALDHAAVAG